MVRKRFLFYFLLIFVGFGLFGLKAYPAHAAGWQFYRSITVTSTTSIASGTNVNFPMLFSGTYSWLEASSSGGKVQNLIADPNGGQEPADLVFATSSANCGTANLNFETDSYVSSTGAISDWVSIPSLSAGSVIYACYGNTAVTIDQSHPSSTWNTNYGVVYHFSAPTSTLSLNDSTVNTNTGTLNPSYNVTATTGQIAGGALFTLNLPTYVIIPVNTSTQPTSSITTSFWVNTAGFNASGGGQGQYFYDSDEDQTNVVGKGASFQQYQGSLYWTLGGPGDDQFAYPYSFDSGWHYMSLTYNGSKMIMYIDGAQVSSSSASGAISWSTNNLYLGVERTMGNFTLSGSMDEFRLSNTAKSPSWILTEYNNQKNPSTFYAVGSEQALATTISVTDTNVVAGLSPLNWVVTSTYLDAAVSNAGDYVAFTGTSNVSVNLDTSVITTPTATRYPVLAWTVNGGPLNTSQLYSGETSLVLASNTTNPVIDLYINGMSPFEDRYDGNTPANSVKITGYAVDSGGATVSSSFPANIWMNIGDSIMSGDASNYSQNEGRPADDNWAESDGARNSYGYLLAQHYGYREVRLAYGGYDWGGGEADGDLPSLNTLIQQITSSSSRLNASSTLSPVPSVVFMNLGENGAPAQSDVTNALTELRSVVASSTKIVVMTPASTNNAASVTTGFNAYIASSSDPQTFLLNLGSISYPTVDSGTHPTAAGDVDIYNDILNQTVPTVTVGAASSVNTSTATLNGTLTFTGFTTSTIKGFYYGTSTSYGMVVSSTGSFASGTFNLPVTGLLASTTYHYQAFATNLWGTATSSDQTFTTASASDTTPPSVTWIVPTSGATISSTVTLTASSTDNVAVSSTSFYFGHFGGTFASSTLVGSTSTPSGTLYSLTWNTTSTINGSTTLYALSTDTSGNTSTASTTVNVQNILTISAVATSSITTSTATISWTTNRAASSSIQYGPTTSYGSSTVTSTLVTSHSITITNLTPSSTYHFAVGSTDGVGNSTTSSDMTFSTLSLIVPSITSFSGAPAFIMPGASSTLSWSTTLASTVSIDQGIGSESATSSGSVIVSPTSTTTYTITATNGSGTSTAQATVTVDGIPPSIPAAPTTTVISASEIDLLWSSSTDNIGVTGYAIFRNSIQIATTTSLVYPDTGLAASTAYTYTLEAYDAAGNFSAQSSSTVATTQSAPSGGGGGESGGSSGGGGSYYYVPAVTTSTSSSSTSTASMSVSQMEALLSSLTTELQALELNAGETTASNSGIIFTRNLSLWSEGSDVNTLQKFLISEDKGSAAVKLKGHGVTQTFGLLTLNALIEFQKSVGITPASGYFGPITRRWVNAHE